MKREYKELFGLGSAGLSGDQVVDIFEYLQTMVRRGKLDRGFNPLPMRVGYHQPCHLKAGGYGVPSKELMGLIPGLRVEDLDSGCCGLSGNYGFKREKYANSMAIGREVFRTVKEMGIKHVVTECGICQLQINHGTGAAVYHPVELLAKAYGYCGYSRAQNSGIQSRRCENVFENGK